MSQTLERALTSPSDFFFTFSGLNTFFRPFSPPLKRFLPVFSLADFPGAESYSLSPSPGKHLFLCGFAFPVVYASPPRYVLALLRFHPMWAESLITFLHQLSRIKISLSGPRCCFLSYSQSERLHTIQIAMNLFYHILFCLTCPLSRF